MSVARKLLVATPEMLDPNFARTVILMIEHDEKGALGVVLTQPTRLELADLLPEWGDVAAPPSNVFRGGPVSPEVAITLADTPGHPPEDFMPIVGAVGLVDAGHGPTSMGGVLRARVFSGYSGWMAGQLEHENEGKSWFVVEPDPGDPFDDMPDTLWERVLERQGGLLSWYVGFPDRPDLN